MIIHDANGVAISSSNPLPVQSGGVSSTSFSTTVTSPNATSAVLVKAATAGKSLYLTDVVISVQVASTVILQDSDGTAVMQTFYFPANTTFSKTFTTPIKVTASKDLDVKASKQGGISVTVSGFIE